MLSEEHIEKAALILLVSTCAPGHSVGSRKPKQVTRSELCEDTQQEPLNVIFALLGIICPKVWSYFCFVLFIVAAVIVVFSCMGNKSIKAPKLRVSLCSWQQSDG